MYVQLLLMKARQADLLRDAARDRLAAQARRARRNAAARAARPACSPRQPLEMALAGGKPPAAPTRRAGSGGS